MYEASLWARDIITEVRFSEVQTGPPCHFHLDVGASPCALFLNVGQQNGESAEWQQDKAYGFL